MSDSMEVRKQRYKDWAKDNLGEKTGIWYAPYLEKLGSLLNRFGLGSSYFENFFYYKTFDEFQEVYQKITGDTDSSLSEILKVKRKNYTKEFVEINETFKQQYAKMEYENGTRSQPTNYGGIAQLGTILRSYLKFLFYAENPEKTYPKKEQKTSSLDGQVDDSVNYWVYAPGEDARLWEEFYASGVMGLGWDFLGDLEQYENRNDVEKVISEHRNDDKRPTNDSKAVWDFYREIKPGDIVYAKAGVKRIVGRGVVTGDYYFDNRASEYKHRHAVDWTNIGSWDLREQVAQKTLTNFNDYPDFIVYMDQLING
ncbi:restriction endonuclease [Lactococcus laudensis]|uniref:restriction endonuclease n=1 Tax=Pseudolactococcus laudensis TaxID=1494461 RepID=UPI0002774F6C|nr:ATPase associated with various cellular activities, AAA_5 [Lactococcus raffinolactis 4877]